MNASHSDPSRALLFLGHEALVLPSRTEQLASLLAQTHDRVGIIAPRLRFSSSVGVSHASAGGVSRSSGVRKYRAVETS